MVEVKFCAKCGGSISSQSIIEGKAKFSNGQLVCSDCLASPQPAAPAPVASQDDSPIAFDMGDAPAADDGQAAILEVEPDSGGDQIQVFAGDEVRSRAAHQFKRQPNVTGKGAIRVRTFDTKLSRAAMDMMDEQINAWLDETGYEIKFVSTTIGDVQGKKTEPHLIINIWY